MAIKQLRLTSGKGLGLLIIGGLVLGGLSFWGVRSLIQSRQEEVAATTEPAPQRLQEAALGRVAPAGRVIELVAGENEVADGDTGQSELVLAYLDIYGVRHAERDYAASQLTEAEALLAAQTQAGEAHIQAAEPRVNQIDQPQLAAIAAQQKTIASVQANAPITNSRTSV